MNDQLTPQQLNQKKTVTGILAIVLGVFGIHYFYIGKPVAGAISIGAFIVTCGITWIVSLIQGIMILTMSDEDFRKRYLDTDKVFPF